MSDMDLDVTIDDFDDCIGFSNRPIKDDKGYVKGKLISMKPTQIIFKEKRTRKEFEDDTTKKVIKFSFLIDGSAEPITLSKVTGTNLSSVKVHTKAKGRGKEKEQSEYNAFTEMCLRLGIFKIGELKENDEGLLNKIKSSMKSISSDKALYIKAKLEDNDTNDFENINIRTIELIEKF